MRTAAPSLLPFRAFQRTPLSSSCFFPVIVEVRTFVTQSPSPSSLSSPATLLEAANQYERLSGVAAAGALTRASGSRVAWARGRVSGWGPRSRRRGSPRRRACTPPRHRVGRSVGVVAREVLLPYRDRDGAEAPAGTAMRAKPASCLQ